MHSCIWKESINWTWQTNDREGTQNEAMQNKATCCLVLLIMTHWSSEYTRMILSAVFAAIYDSSRVNTICFTAVCVGRCSRESSCKEEYRERVKHREREEYRERVKHRKRGIWERVSLREEGNRKRLEVCECTYTVTMYAVRVMCMTSLAVFLR